MTAGEVRENWAELLAVLARTAPRSHAAVRPPRGDVGLAEVTLGIDLGPDLRTWFALHGGSDDLARSMLFPDGCLIDVDHAVRKTAMVHQIWRDEVGDGDDPPDVGAAGSVAATWVREYVMYCDDTCGGGGFIDLRPGLLHGCARRWDKVEADMWELRDTGPVAPSLAALLAEVTRSLRTGEPLAGRSGEEWRPSVVDGYLSWGYPCPSEDSSAG